MRYAEKYCVAGQVMIDNTAHEQCILENWVSTHTHTHTHTHSLAHSHSQYVIIIAFQQQQWLHKRASVLRHRYSASLVYSDFYLHLHKSKQLLFSATSNKLHCTAEK